jgi:hypothetical protein
VTPIDSSTATATASATSTVVACAGDCDGSDQVTINELVTAVNAALGNAMLSADNRFLAVNRALAGC